MGRERALLGDIWVLVLALTDHMWGERHQCLLEACNRNLSRIVVISFRICIARVFDTTVIVCGYVVREIANKTHVFRGF